MKRVISYLIERATHYARLIHAGYLIAECGYTELNAYKAARLL